MIRSHHNALGKEQFYRSSNLNPATIHEYLAQSPERLNQIQDLATLFSQSDFYSQHEHIASSLNHFRLWQHIATTNNERHVIFEDSARPSADFKARWNGNFSAALPLTAKLVYLGGMLPSNMWLYKAGDVLEPYNDFFSRHSPNNFFRHDFLPGVDNFTQGAPTRRFFYAPCAYMLSSAGARDLVSFVEKYGFRKAAAHTLYRMLQWTDEAYATTPLMVQVSVPPKKASVPQASPKQPPTPESSTCRGQHCHVPTTAPSSKVVLVV